MNFNGSHLSKYLMNQKNLRNAKMNIFPNLKLKEISLKLEEERKRSI